jgi:2-iminoacetate synthase ThiH
MVVLLVCSSRYDLCHQLEEIEGRQEEYWEIISFIRLLNSIMEAAPHDPYAATDLAHMTDFILHKVLGCLWLRAYK